MLICDTHADTLWYYASEGIEPRTRPCDITLEMLTSDKDNTRLHTLAMFICTDGMKMKPTIVQRELTVLEKLKKQGFRQVTRVEDAIPGAANCLLSIEDCAAFDGDLDNVEKLAAVGVKMAGLIWNNENGIGEPAMTGNSRGLTSYGRQLVERLRYNHIAVDTSHLNIRGTDEVLDSDIPAAASHSCVYSLCDHPRNLNDDQLRKFFRSGGYVGINFCASFLTKKTNFDSNVVVDHLAYMCDLGGEDCVGIGSDFDGITDRPSDLQNAAELPNLIKTMRRRGFPEDLVEKIAGLNFKRFMNVIDKK